MDKLLRDCAVLAGSVAGDIRGSEIGGSSRNVMPELCHMHRPVSHVEVEEQASMVIEWDIWLCLLTPLEWEVIEEQTISSAGSLVLT